MSDSRVVYATSTISARAHRSARIGINRIANAPVWHCGFCGFESVSEQGMDAHDEFCEGP